ncbi:hypothetical protein [Kiloniella antarctica]|uniref:Cyclodeaminase/cyclohydrolase domain-containing protein n=1 Tax=Kiloniella antarctica TaxID=1550907 RepID=A0ABW5BP43_9PROT
MRYLARADYAPLKNLARELVRLCGGGKHAAEISRACESSISGYVSNTSPQFMPIDVVADLEAHTGQRIISQYLVDLTNELSSPVREVNPLLMAAALGGDLGAFCVAATQAMEDGHLTNQELDDLIKKAETILFSVQKIHDSLSKYRQQRRVSNAAE